jgi:hypothetical protein
MDVSIEIFHFIRSFIMKRSLFLALCLLVLGTGIFALDVVIGGGGLYGFAREMYKYDDGEDNYRYDVDATTFGAFAFFGLSRYMEASIAVYAGNNKAVYDDGSDESFPSSQVGVSFFLKYPFLLSDKFVIFPTIGADLQNNGGGLDLWAAGGIGLDFFITERVFLRGQAIYRYGFLFIFKGELNKDIEGESPSHGPLFKIGLGRMY